VRISLRTRLLGLFLVLVIVVGSLTLGWIERTLASDLKSALHAQLENQGRAVADWLAIAGHVDRLAPRLAAVTGTRLTIVGADGIVQGDSHDAASIGQPIGAAPEIDIARRGGVAQVERALRPGEPQQYLVAVPAKLGRVIRLAVPLDIVRETRARMRNRLIVGFTFGFVGALFLSWIFLRAITRPIQAMTRTAERLAKGDYDVPPPTVTIEAGGEFGLLARTMMHMAGEVKAHVGELTEQRDLLSVVFGGLVEGVVVIDPTGKMVLANAAARPLVGDQLSPELFALVERARAGEKAEAELELVGRTVRASARPLRASDRNTGEQKRIEPTPLPSSPRLGVIVVLYDITRMRALEAVRREFLSNAAHELRTPVTSISGYAETLLGGGIDADTSKEFITTIHRNAKRIADMVSDLMVLDQLGGRDAVVSERVPVALGDVVEDAVRTAKGVTPSAQIDVAVAPALSVLGTREGLEHVVQNLVDNAVKYGKGTPVKVHATTIGARVRLAIEDAGPGIPEGHEERIFERFYRVDSGRSRDRGGTGLGLAIVKSQVEAMGGRVWFEHANPGARFCVELDAA